VCNFPAWRNIWVSVCLSSETFYYPPVVRTMQLYTQFTRKKRI
jgi:hypothetical protein